MCLTKSTQTLKGPDFGFLFHRSQSPELEPDIRHYVRVCTVCRQALEVVQVENYEASMKGEESEDCLKQMKDLFDNIVKFQDKIDAWLPKVLISG